MSNNILTIKTVQVNPLRVLSTALKDILFESNIAFSADGIRITNMDKSHTILVHMFMPAENFELYECKTDKILIGVTMLYLYKILNSPIIDNTDTLTIYIENKDYSGGIVSFLSFDSENQGIEQCLTQKLRTIEPGVDEINYPDVQFSSIINFPSSDFQKIIRHMFDVSNRIEIKSVGGELLFQSNGPYMNAKLKRTETNDGMSFIAGGDSDKINQGEFSLKNLGHFIKCTGLCHQIEIYLENDLPLVVKYNIASLGEIKLCLLPLPSLL